MREILTGNKKILIKLGTSYFDTVHKIEGVAMAVAQFLSGCDQVCLERVVDGKVEELWIDVTRLEPAEKQAMQVEPGPGQTDDPGGPHSTPTRRSTPRRHGSRAALRRPGR